LHHGLHNDIYQVKKTRELKIARFTPHFEMKFAPDIIGTFFWSKKALSRFDAVTAAVIALMTGSKALSRLCALSAAAAAVISWFARPSVKP